MSLWPGAGVQAGPAQSATPTVAASESQPPSVQPTSASSTTKTAAPGTLPPEQVLERCAAQMPKYDQYRRFQDAGKLQLAHPQYQYRAGDIVALTGAKAPVHRLCLIPGEGSPADVPFSTFAPDLKRPAQVLELCSQARWRRGTTPVDLRAGRIVVGHQQASLVAQVVIEVDGELRSCTLSHALSDTVPSVVGALENVEAVVHTPPQGRPSIPEDANVYWASGQNEGAATVTLSAGGEVLATTKASPEGVWAITGRELRMGGLQAMKVVVTDAQGKVIHTQEMPG